eukprot:765233-Hanusia_phi.AAC.1
MDVRHVREQQRAYRDGQVLEGAGARGRVVPNSLDLSTSADAPSPDWRYPRKDMGGWKKAHLLRLT